MLWLRDFIGVGYLMLLVTCMDLESFEYCVGTQNKFLDDLGLVRTLDIPL